MINSFIANNDRHRFSSFDIQDLVKQISSENKGFYHLENDLLVKFKKG